MPNTSPITVETAITYLLVSLASLVAIVRMVAPRAFEAFLSRFKAVTEQELKEREFQREQVEAAAAAEAAENVALFQTMVQLQTKALDQNDRLLDFVIKNLRDDLRTLGETLRCEMAEMKASYFYKVSGELEALREEQRVMKADIMRILQEQVAFRDKILGILEQNGYAQNQEK
jgi:hypothetical protein